MLLYVTTATFGPLFLRGIAERKNGAGFFQCLTIEFLEKLFCSFWVQQRSCLGRQQVPTTLQIFSSQLAIINFKTFSPRNFPTRESREQGILWEDKERRWGVNKPPKVSDANKKWMKNERWPTSQQQAAIGPSPSV